MRGHPVPRTGAATKKGGREAPPFRFEDIPYCLPKICSGRVVLPVALGKSG
jgi:hypothetical protein